MNGYIMPRIDTIEDIYTPEGFEQLNAEMVVISSILTDEYLEWNEMKSILGRYPIHRMAIDVLEAEVKEDFRGPQRKECALIAYLVLRGNMVNIFREWFAEAYDYGWYESTISELSTGDACLRDIILEELAENHANHDLFHLVFNDYLAENNVLGIFETPLIDGILEAQSVHFRDLIMEVRRKMEDDEESDEEMP